MLGQIGLWQHYLVLRRSGKFKHATLLTHEEGSGWEINLEFLCEVLGSCASPCDAEEEVFSRDPGKYLRDLIWSMQMYIEGKCPDFRFICSPFRIAAKGLVEHLQSCICTGKKRYKMNCAATLDSIAMVSD